MKKIISIGLIVFILSVLTSCAPVETQEKMDKVSPPFKVIDTTYDKYNHLIQQILFNEETRKTYVFDYYYQYNNGLWECFKTELTVLDNEGNVISEKDIEND